MFQSRFEQRHDQPAFGILEQGLRAQLVVLGRHTASHRMAGFAFGSVTRAVLHYSTAPVAVVPESPSQRRTRPDCRRRRGQAPAA